MKKILVAEDDSVSRHLLHHMLEPFGQVESVEHGGKAIEAFASAHASGESYDLVLLDIMMPQADGFEVLRKIREIENSAANPSTPCTVVMVTALSDQESFLRAHHEGSEWFVTKPIERSTLFEALADLGFEPAGN